eukprot:2936900-Pyramimonas_sp.AAC.1
MLRVVSWVPEHVHPRTLNFMARDICYGSWMRSAPSRRNVISYFNRLDRQDTHEAWERAVHRHWQALRNVRMERRSLFWSCCAACDQELHC